MDFLRGMKRSFVSNFVDSSILEQPPYDVVQEGADYEKRFYPAGNWIGTVVKEKVEEIYEENGTVTSFFRLMKYVNGENETGAKTELTFPVMVRVTYEPDSNMIKKGEMFIYIHSSQQKNPPEPTNKALWIEKLPPLTVYARRFSGYAKDATYLTEVESLKSNLSRDGHMSEVDKTVSYSAGYDAPTKMMNRRNEVWLQIINNSEDSAQDR